MRDQQREDRMSMESAQDRPDGERTGGTDIAARAYRKYEARGFEHGHDIEDWLEAEREAGERHGETRDEG